MNSQKLVSNLLFVLFSCTFFTLYPEQTNEKTLYLPASYSQDKFDSSECKVFWDIHNTLVKRDKKEFLKPLAEHATFIATQLIYYSYEKINYVLTGNKGPLLELLEEKEKLKKEDCSGEGYYELFKSYDQRLADLTVKMANAYKPIAGMPELVQEIPCKQLYASNIGKRFLTNLQEKELNENFPAIAGGQVISFNKEQTDPTFDQETELATVPYKTQKPHTDYFTHIQKQFNTGQKSTLVFVDDKVENVRKAQETGFVGILFINLEQLKTDLQKIGLIE